jgi:hypothetical protein
MMGRRSDADLVDEIIGFFIDHKREKNISLTDFCEWLGINSATAKKWLDLLLFIKAMCPDFYLEEEGRNVNIKFPVESRYARYNNHTVKKS